MANNLRPPSSINDLRTQAHMMLSARLESLDLTPVLVATLGTNVPVSILPYLVWQFDMMIPAVAMQALGASLLAIIQNALPLHKIAGTPGSIVQALELCGYTGVSIQEGQSSWGGTNYPASQGWAVFRVLMGGASAGTMVSQGVTPAPNGSNITFALPYAPAGSSLRTFYNGLLLRPTTDFTDAGTVLTTTFTPANNSRLSAAFRTSPISSVNVNNVAIIANFFKAGRCLLDSVVVNYPAFFDAVVPSISGSVLTFPETFTSLELYRNGEYQTSGVDYAPGTNTVTVTVPPGSDKFIAWGTYGTSGTTPAFHDYAVPAGAINGSNTVFTLPYLPSPAAGVRLYMGPGGASLLMTQGTDYTLSGTTLTYAAAPPAGSQHTTFFRS
jgi:hypothetical protein